MKLKNIVFPRSASDEEVDLGSLLDGMDGDPAPEQETEPEPEPEVEEPEKEEPAKPSKDDKAAHAFAELRKRASQADTYGQLLGKLASANGIEYADENDLLSKLNDDVLDKLAKQQNVPVELLKRMESLEQDSIAYQQARLKDSALIGFQNVMTTYGLDQDELQAFAAELDAEGKNPFVTEINLVDEYKVMHFDDIVNSKVEAAVQAALTKDQKASQHGTVPNNKKGGGNDSGEKITTIGGLNSLLAELK